jgi:hypothetical protein
MTLELNGEYWEEGEGGVLIKDGHHFRLWTALKGLEFETRFKGMKFTRISSLKVLHQYFFGLKRTKKGAYEQLQEAGVYKIFIEKQKDKA